MNQQTRPATSKANTSASTCCDHTKQAFVLYSDLHGLYLGSCMDIRFWTMLDKFSLHCACTFEDEAAARAHIDAWNPAPPSDIRSVAVMEDEPGFVSISACIAAGLPARNPSGGMH